MKINIITIGTFKSKDYYGYLFDEYKKRMNWNINLIEIRQKNYQSVELQKINEEKLLMAHHNINNKLVVLDERGKIISTTDFENVLSNFEMNGEIDFIIGGSDGLSQNIRDKADFMLSFGKMVFPHLMVRVMLIEQIYRVYTLKNNHPYHK